jgi:phospholipid/cholesterol/gamma-HCH transport system substrate-binding protein
MTVSPARVGAAAAIAVAALVLVLVVSSGGSGNELRAEFTSARGLVKGNEVRVLGAPAGKVADIELTDRGTALVTIDLHDGLPAARRDATAAIRPVDLLGDVYVSLSLGSDPEPLDGKRIDRAHTSNAPRIDQLLRAFGPSQRAGLQAIIVESGLMLDRRGEDLARTAIALRPALEATDAVMRELGSQNAALGELVQDARRATGQLAGHSRDLGGLVSGLAATTRATAERAPELDAALAGAAPTLRQLRTTVAALARTAGDARPLATSLRSAAPGLATTADRLSPFLDETLAASRDLRPVLRSLRAVLVNGRDTFPGLAGGISRLGSSSDRLEAFAKAFEAAAPGISEGFFVNFPDQAAEPGDQPFDPFTDPRRHYWRGAAVASCEMFGVKVKPNCLSDVLAATARLGSTAEADTTGAATRAVRPPQSPSPMASTSRSLLDFLLSP